MSTLGEELEGTLAGLREAGLYKEEWEIESPQSAHVRVGGRDVLNLCANNYLGLASHPAVIEAAHAALDRWGFGMASVRFICGTQSIHTELERRISEFLGTEDTILYSSCFDANAGLFESLLTAEDAVISDELNHASVIDGIRLCKARRLRYRNGDMADLERCLTEAADARHRLIATDGVFSMDGYLADLAGICDLAGRHDALVMVDDSHAVGFVGPRGRGTPEHFGVVDRVDVLTGTLGKAMGGASGGYASGRREIVEILRQRSRPYLFSNSLAPPIVGAALATLDLLESSDDLRTPPGREHRLVPRSDGRRRLRGAPRRAPDRAGDVRRRGRRRGLRARPARPRRLRGQLHVSGRAAGQGPHPHADVGGARPRRPRGRRSGVRGRSRDVAAAVVPTAIAQRVFQPSPGGARRAVR